MVRKIQNICKVTFYPLTSISSDVFRPGLDTVSFEGDGLSLDMTSATFTEEDLGSSECVQTFAGVVTDTSQGTSQVIFSMCAVFGLLAMTLSTGEILVAGSPEFPLVLQCQREGRPQSYRLAFKRNSSEKAKYRVL